MNPEGSSERIPLRSTSQGIPDPNVSMNTMHSPDRSASKSLAERLQQSMLYDHDDSTLASQTQGPDETSFEEPISNAFANEERRLLHAVTLACHRLNDETRDEEISGAENAPASHWWSTLLDSLNDLYTLWSSPPSNIHAVDHRHHGNGRGHDLDLEAILSTLLTTWQFAIEGSDLLMKKTPILQTTIKIMSLLSKVPHGKEILLQLHLKTLACLIPSTISYLLTTSVSPQASLMETDHHTTMHEEKKNDEYHVVDADQSRIEEVSGANDTGPYALFQFVMDITMNRRSSPKSTYDEFVAQLLSSLLQRHGYSNPLFMTDISAILWKWSVSSAHCLVQSSHVWEAIEFMWVFCYEHESQRISSFMESDFGSKILSNLAAAVGTMISSISRDDTTMDVMTTEEGPDVAFVQKQEWLIRCLINEISGTRVASRDGCRRRCMRIIRCFAATSWGRTFLWNQISQADFVVVLLQVMRSVEEDVDTRTLACQTLEFMIGKWIVEVHLGPYIETTLIEIIEGDPDIDDDSHIRDIPSCNKLILSACEALTLCLQCSPWSRSPECFTETMFENLLHLLHSNVDQPTYHSNISELFVQLTAKQPQIEGHDEIHASTRIKGICNLIASYPSVLEMLAMLLSPTSTNSDFEKVRKDTIVVLSVLIENDTTDITNQQLMAADDYLLTALVNVCLMNTNESPLKDEAKRIILTLIPEL
jgi:hypothetical protein